MKILKEKISAGYGILILLLILKTVYVGKIYYLNFILKKIVLAAVNYFALI